MAYYYDGYRLSDDEDEAREIYESEYMDDIIIAEFLMGEIDLSKLVRWCFTQEEFYEKFSEEINHAKENAFDWDVKRIDDEDEDED